MRILILILLLPMFLYGEQIEKACQQISRECTYSVRYFPNRSFQFAISILNYTVGHVSAPNYGYLVDLGQPTYSDVEDILDKQAGICQSAQLVFLAIAKNCNIEARPVYIWYAHPNGSGMIAGHAVVEVFYKDKWRYLDPTWGSFFRLPETEQDDVLSLIEVLQLDSETRKNSEVAYKSLLWRQAADTLPKEIGSGMDWMDFQHLKVQVDSYTGPIIYER